MIADTFPTLFLCIWQLRHIETILLPQFSFKLCIFFMLMKTLRKHNFDSFNNSVTFTYMIVHDVLNYFSIFGYLSCCTYFKFLYFNNC